MSKSAKITKLLEEAIINVKTDRKKALSLLEDVSEYIGEKQERHGEVGLTTAKYLEVLQKSNEQLVRIISLINDTKDDEFGDLDKDDKENLYKDFEQLPEKIEMEIETEESDEQ